MDIYMKNLNEWVDKAWQDLTDKINYTSHYIGVGTPNFTEDGKYIYSPKSFWTKGFWPGILWLTYVGNGKQQDELKELAVECENALDDVLNGFYMLHHDNGFVWSLSSVAQYKLNNNPASRRRALTAASHLAGRFNLKGNFIRAWNAAQGAKVEGWAIIDCLMNLPLLYWASEETEDPRFRHIAMAHADTVLQYFIREDGSSYHITCFDPESGEHVGYQAGQGFSVDSAWARGASWALYGLTLSYRYTKEERYLEAAKRVADFWMKSTGSDYVSRWDFRAPEEMDDKDTSAAACAACGLIELSHWLPLDEGTKYYVWGAETVKALYERYGTWGQNDQEGLLVGGTFNYPKQFGLNCSLIYGDYFYTEALYQLKGNSIIFW